MVKIIFIFFTLCFFSAGFAENHSIDLTIAYKTVDFSGKKVKAIAVNNQIPGPTLHFKEGDHVSINVYNKLDKPTSIHWHGMIVPWQMDGVVGISQKGISPGGVFHYEFTLHQSGTYWYHAHAGLQEQQGLYGVFIIDPIKPSTYSYTKDYTIVLSDWSNTDPDKILANLKKEGDYYSPNFPLQPSLMKFLKDYKKASPTERKALWEDYKSMQQMRMSIYDLSDVAYDTFLLNGQPPAQPWTALVKKGDIVRLRFIGAAGSTIFHVKIPGATLQMIHVQGNDVKPYEVNDFFIAPGETDDVLVKIEKDAPDIIYAESMDTVGAAVGALVTSPIQGVNYKSVAPFPEPLPMTREMMSTMMGKKIEGNLPEKSGNTTPMTMPMDHGNSQTMTMSMDHGDSQSMSMPMNHGDSQSMSMPMNHGDSQSMSMPMNHGDSQSMSMPMNHGDSQSMSMPMNHGDSQSMSMPMDHGNSQSMSMPMNHGDSQSMSMSMDHGNSQSMSMPMNHGDSQSMSMSMDHGNSHSMVMPTEPTIMGDKLSQPTTFYSTSQGTFYDNLVATVPTNDPQKPVDAVINMELFGYMDRYVWFINGVPEEKAPPIVLNPNKRYRFVFTNTSMMHHPMHLHGHWFILRKGEGAYDPLLHTMDVPPGATITADVDTDASGQWIFHCHLLYHMDAGMARTFQYSTLLELTQQKAQPENYYSSTSYHNRPVLRVDESMPLDTELVNDPMMHSHQLWSATFLDLAGNPVTNTEQMTLKGLYGSDYHKLEIFVNDAEMKEGSVENADADIFYYHPINQFWALKGGANYFYRPTENPYWQPGVGLEGLMPYFIDTNLRSYYHAGSSKWDLQFSRDTQITNNFFIGAEIRGILATKTVQEDTIGSGLNEMRYSIRPYYRVAPGFSLFTEFEHDQDYGDFKDLQISEGESATENTLTFGFSWLF